MKKSKFILFACIIFLSMAFVSGCCDFAADCDDDDMCTTDRCVDSICQNVPVECPDDAFCSYVTGECLEFRPTTLLEADGVYMGAGNCSDEDNEVMLNSDDSIVTLSEFTGNGDIVLHLTNDTTASTTDSDVVAFGTPGHSLTLTLNPLSGEISFVLGTAGVCSSTLTPGMYYQ